MPSKVALKRMLLLVASAGAAFADQTGEPGLMLREGTWDGDVGTYELPQGLSATDPKGWPHLATSIIKFGCKPRCMESRRAEALAQEIT